MIFYGNFHWERQVRKKTHPKNEGRFLKNPSLSLSPPNPNWKVMLCGKTWNSYHHFEGEMAWVLDTKTPWIIIHCESEWKGIGFDFGVEIVNNTDFEPDKFVIEFCTLRIMRNQNDIEGENWRNRNDMLRIFELHRGKVHCSTSLGVERTETNLNDNDNFLE